MPKITSNTPMEDIVIQGITFSAPTPYAHGHVLTENEAAALNQTFLENLRNNFAGKIKAAAEDEQPQPTQEDFAEYFSKYEFGVRAPGFRAGNPVEKEAMDIARGKVKEALTKKGISLSDVTAKRLTELAEQALAKHPEWKETAKAIVESRKAIGAASLDDIV